MPNSFDKIINLINKTGDNCVVLDHQGNPAYVVVKFDKYQSMILNKSEVAGLTEDELLDKINRDVATWKANQDAEDQDNWQAVNSAVEEIKISREIDDTDNKLLNKAKNDQDKNDTDEKYYFEPID
ncbi:MAG: hypothetical protein CMI53_05485 [Parcubacteria group bacterium]|jgi:aminoglycoside phosphotransferase family enzyme|nr:hypothetical protein [Parcubacteria group bacterium]|tara:strand:- start:28234 stop:28611 length:378 start_codon:yes stop_codon:yes gene_type:complete